MTFLLVTLLTFAIIVTLIGFFLTAKTQLRNQCPDYIVARSSRRAVDTVPIRGGRVLDEVPFGRGYIDDPMPVPRRRVVDSVPMRPRSLSVGTEMRTVRSISVPALWARINGRQMGEPIPWSVIVIGLVSIFILGLYTLNLVLPNHAFFHLVLFPQNVTSAPTSSQQPNYNASQNLERISQLDPLQYNSPGEFHSWAYSACSTASMTEVINSYGHRYRITDILKVEAGIGEITPELGLLEDIGIQRTIARFGFKTTWGHNLSLDQIINIANHGRPVIVSFPPDRYAGGHLLVVTGGDGNYVYLADSSLWNRHSLSRARFLNWWEGFYAIVTPN
jgi:hypothetical protein